jgi:NADH-quinone oxidoreductase subunit M
MPILMWLFILSLASCWVPLLLARADVSLQKTVAILLSLIPLSMMIYGHSELLGSSINYPWFTAIPINFHLSVDELSLLFLYLTGVIVPISLCAVRVDTINYPHTFYALVLFLQALLIGFFTARDVALFAVFWEAMLIPLYFIINIWGSENRQKASLKFLIYMIAGSVFMVAAVIGLYMQVAKTFDLDVLTKIAEGAENANLIFAVFAIAFAVKTPLFPFHSWLPDTYCQAPVPGTILLSALLSKAGIYGFLRIGFELFPSFMHAWGYYFLILAIAGVLYGGLAAWKQNDYKRLIAYSSFSHVNFILAGIFVWNETAHTGAVLQALNHGITIAALFLVAGWLEERIGNTRMGQVSGLAKFTPNLCWLTLFFVLASVALPGTNNFIGEILILFGLFKVSPWLTATLALSIILSVIYMLRFMQKIYFEEPSKFQDKWTDIKGKEFLIALPLVVLILWIGIYPAPVINMIKTFASKGIS